MDIHEKWQRALTKTEVVRPRVMPLSSVSETQMPYIFLAESSVNMGDTVVRKGRVAVDKPSIVLPQNMPQFFGFDSDDEPLNYDTLTNFLLVRGVRFPSFKYNNQTDSLDIREGKLSAAIEHYRQALQQEENVSAGLVVGPEDCWQFSVLIYVCMQVSKSAEQDIRRLIEEFKRGH